MEERIAKIEELKTLVRELVSKHNECLIAEEFGKLTRIDKEIEEAVNECTAESRSLCFEGLKKTADPMLEAVKKLTFLTIRVKDVKDNETGTEHREVEDKEVQIDLEKLDKHCGGIGKDGNWIHIVQKINFLLTAKKAEELGIDPTSVNDSYSMSEIARGIEMGKNPTSKTNILKTLQSAVTATIGEEYKATSHDVNFLLSVYGKKGKAALTVTCSKHSSFRNLLAEVCHRIVMGKGYELDYKKKKGM